MPLRPAAPLILLSPAKTLNFNTPLSPALAAAPASPLLYPEQATALVSSLSKQSKAQIKSLMGLSDSLAALNHARYADFEAQPERKALGAFEGQAYKTLDAPSLDAPALDYLQGSLRILCGLYGMLRPCDEIRAYRLEMGTKFSCAGASNLYDYWGTTLADRLNAELGEMAEGAGKFVLNVASQEYAKSACLGEIRAPVITAVFPGPAVYAKMARGEMVRFCAERRLTDPAQLAEFTGAAGEWRHLPAESTETTLVFHRGGGGGKGKAKAKARAAADEGGAASPASKRGRKK